MGMVGIIVGAIHNAGSIVGAAVNSAAASARCLVTSQARREIGGRGLCGGRPPGSPGVSLVTVGPTVALAPAEIVTVADPETGVQLACGAAPIGAG